MCAGTAGSAWMGARTFAVVPGVGGGPAAGAGVGIRRFLAPQQASGIPSPTALTVGAAGSSVAFAALMAAATVGFAAAVAARTTSIVAMFARSPNTKHAAKWKRFDKMRRRPEPSLHPLELAARVKNVMSCKRKDTFEVEMAAYLDPRDEIMQRSVRDVKLMMETPGFTMPDQQREQQSVPPAPFSEYDSALMVIRGQMGRPGQKAPEQQQDQDDGKKKKRKGGKKKTSTVDLTDIDTTFVDFRGIQMTKKERARLETNQKTEFKPWMRQNRSK